MTPPEATTLSATPPAAAAAAAVVPPAAAAAAPDAAALQRQIDDLTRQNAETKRTAEFWYEKASKPADEVKTPPASAEPDVDILDLATKGGKAFNAYLDGWALKNGYVKGAEMDNAIAAKTSELVKQTELVARYPDLKQPKKGEQPSEFFSATALEYGGLKKRGYSDADAMEIAADRVALQFLQEGKMKTPAQLETDRKATETAERRARATAGQGEHSNRTPVDADDDETLDADQLSAVRQLADGLDISIEDATKRYIARAKAGVRMSRRS